MSEEKDFIYDDDEAVKFIKNFLPLELKNKFSDDNINYIVDLIYEFYDSKGLLDGDDDSMVEFDEEELIEFVIKNAQRDGFGKYSPDEITYIVQGELAYCDSIELFD
ncbi:MAG: hypothetical protein LBV72_05700 [Tannerella sp.]|jgi:hypothetical protein|nr:hypothetical protein [Tannerella sp.]